MLKDFDYDDLKDKALLFMWKHLWWIPVLTFFVVPFVTEINFVIGGLLIACGSLIMMARFEVVESFFDALGKVAASIWRIIVIVGAVIAGVLLGLGGLALITSLAFIISALVFSVPVAILYGLAVYFTELTWVWDHYYLAVGSLSALTVIYRLITNKSDKN